MRCPAYREETTRSAQEQEGVAERPISTREHRLVTRPHYTCNKTNPAFTMIHRVLTRCPRRLPCTPSLSRSAYTRSPFDHARKPNSSAPLDQWHKRVTVVRLGSAEPRDTCLILFSNLKDRPTKNGTHAPEWRMGC